MPDTPHRSGRSARAEPREIAELRRLKTEQPQLEHAIDFQIALIGLQRRVQARVPTPWIEVDPTWLRHQHEQGKPFLRFEEIPLDWTEFRLMFRQTADILLRYEAIEAKDHEQLQALARAGNQLEPIVIQWYRAVAARAGTDSVEAAAPGADRAQAGDQPYPGGPAAAPVSEALDQVVALAMRPFLERCAEVVQQRADLTTWQQAYCPLCGGEPEFALITPGADRLLICGRCTARWRFAPITCPYCGNDDRSRITSFSSRDGRYRVYACEGCRRYLKAYDGRAAARPLMLAVDAIATLPLDAAAIQRGYRG